MNPIWKRRMRDVLVGCALALLLTGCAGLPKVRCTLEPPANAEEAPAAPGPEEVERREPVDAAMPYELPVG